MKCLAVLAVRILNAITSSRNALRGTRKAQRWALPLIILAAVAAISLGQYRSRSAPRRVLQLPEPKLTGSLTFEEALAQRRSARQFIPRELTLAQLGQLAWAGQGITDRQTGLRTAPSAGAAYPITLYLATQNGLFFYNPGLHALEQTSDLDVRPMLAAASMQQDAVAQAPCDIIVTGSTRKLAAEYRKQARKYMLLEAGQVAQNIQLQAVSLGLGAVPAAVFDVRDIGKICRLPKELEPVYIVCAGYPAPTDLEGQAGQRRAVLITGSANFRDEELFETQLVLDQAGVNTVIASSRRGLIGGMLGGTADARILVTEVNVDEFDAIVFIGGPGAREYFNNPVAHNIAREAAGKGKILAAISIAPTILANAGVLTGVRATSFLTERDMLQLADVKYTGAAVERDGPIITGRDPAASRLFATAIVEALSPGP
ncbi:MAG: DJ-1/PfpI family protein [Planctomycetota bacterium]|jgi:protease I